MKTGHPGFSYFSEEQRFRKPPLIIVVVSLVGVSWFAFISQVIYKRPFGTHPMPDVGMWIVWAVFGIGFPLLFLSMRMTTEVDGEGILVRFPPFFRRRIPLGEIQSCEVREYSALREYGGWGVRYSLRHGTAYNVSGNHGVQLVLQDGKRLLIGSQDPDRLAGTLGGLLRYKH
jgi:hypothetical protein